MCRSKDSGGRRCGDNAHKREAHNRRRRVNNSIKNSVTSWASTEASENRDQLLSSTPGQVKQWALENNVPFNILARNVDKTDAISDVASSMHDDWRNGRRNEDGTFEPRLKDDGNGGEVDIANTAYADLPEKWQAENKASAESAINAVVANDRDIDAAADQIHKDWLDRNGEWAPDEQKLPYAELSEEEKEKDRVVARAAAARLGLKYPDTEDQPVVDDSANSDAETRRLESLKEDALIAGNMSDAARHDHEDGFTNQDAYDKFKNDQEKIVKRLKDKAQDLDNAHADMKRQHEALIEAKDNLPSMTLRDRQEIDVSARMVEEFEESASDAWLAYDVANDDAKDAIAARREKLDKAKNEASATTTPPAGKPIVKRTARVNALLNDIDAYLPAGGVDHMDDRELAATINKMRDDIQEELDDDDNLDETDREYLTDNQMILNNIAKELAKTHPSNAK